MRHDTKPSGRRRYGRGGFFGRCKRCAENPRIAADLGEWLGQWGWTRWDWYRTPADSAVVRKRCGRCGWIVKEFLAPTDGVQRPGTMDNSPPVSPETMTVT